MKGLALIALALWAACVWDSASGHKKVNGDLACATAIATIADLVWVLVA